MATKKKPTKSPAVQARAKLVAGSPKSVRSPRARVKVESRPRNGAGMHSNSNSTRSQRSLTSAGLFAGVGGIESGLERAGHRTHFLCENDPPAMEVLRSRFEGVPIWADVRKLDRLPAGTELLTAGFPCQDLSQAGMTRGIAGARSGLVVKVFDLLRARRAKVPFVLLENVPFMLKLGRGRALDVIIAALEDMGYRWAYRVVDSRAFGLPQRRQRVFLLAALDVDPATVLFADDAGAPDELTPSLRRPNGFYWTEGLRGLGWANDAVPTLKGGSTIGIPSPPALILPNGEIGKPDLRDAERLQGFSVDWTRPAERVVKTGFRWKLVGNAVTVDVAAWVGRRLRDPGTPLVGPSREVVKGRAWPAAAMGADGRRYEVTISAWPIRVPNPGIRKFLQYPLTPLSERAIAGFHSRMKRSTLRFPEGFREAVAGYLARVRSQERLAI